MNTKKIQFSGLLSVGQAPTSEANNHPTFTKKMH